MNTSMCVHNSFASPRGRIGSWPCSLLAVLVALPIESFAQPNTRDQQIQMARNVSQNAENLAKTGATDQAIALVTAQLTNAVAWPRPARAQLSFTLAWLYGDLATKQPEKRAELLLQSSNYYQRVLFDYPRHAEASENLAQLLSKLGYFSEAITVLSQVPATNQTKGQIYTRLLAMGDLYAKEGKASNALANYDRAFELHPEDERAPWRVVSISPTLPDGWPQRLFAYCQRFTKAGLLQVAGRGYEQIIREESQGERPSSLVIESSIAWVDLEARRGALSAASLTRLPPGLAEKVPALGELKACIENPSQQERTFNYWRSSPLMQHIIASALRTLAKQQRLAERPDYAAALYDEALKLAPGFEVYSSDELRDRPLVRLETALDLAALYQAHPKLDPEGQKFRSLEDRLQNEKDMSYAQSNLPAMEQYHIVLGLIYAERGRWTVDNRRAAPYHLEHAVSTAQSIAGRNPSEHKPLPQLTRLLAEGLTTNAQPNLSKAHQLYLDAAQGYLDKDDLHTAEKMLDESSALSRRLPKIDPSRYLELKQLLDTRKTIRTLQSNDFAPGASAKIDPRPWTNPRNTRTLDPVFLQRQSVRVLDELGTKAQNVGAKAEAERLYELTVEKLQAAPGATHEDVRRVRESPARPPSQKKMNLDSIEPRKGLPPDQQILKESELKKLR